MAIFSNEQVRIFLSLFRGREDVFAVRWEKDGKFGYMPAYDLNWDEFAKHKQRGGTLKDFPHKQVSKLSDQRIINHLTGKEVIGLYPLLADNSSWFIVADFDETLISKRSWIDECRAFIEICNQYQLPAYLERSRSGKGGHVWIFFDSNFPAFKSRKIVLHILEFAGIISPFDKNSNYDRLFPNQNYHSGKGFGNLVALPLHQKALENNNSCFINPNSLAPFEDQWEFLQKIQRVTIERLNKIFDTIECSSPDNKIISAKGESTENGIRILLNNQVAIPRKQLSPDLVLFLRDNLNFVNSEYIIKKKLGKNTFGTAPYFRMLEEKDGLLLLPKGFIGKLLRFCHDQKIKYQLIDERKKLTEVNFFFKASLYEYQEEVIAITDKKEMGIIVAPPGSGKTIMGLGIVAHKKQPVLIIVHRKQLFDQWVERIQSFLGIADGFIGKISHGQQKIGTHITVAMIQSLTSIDTANEIFKSFGMIIIDECHHVPAKTFRQVVKKFSSYYMYGLTATPVRKNNDEKLIFIHIGDVIQEVKFPFKNNSSAKKVSVIIRETDLLFPFDYKTDKTEMLSQILIHDSERNRLIVEDIKKEANTGKKVLVLTERKAHIEVLYQYLKNKYRVITISGEDSELARKAKLKQIKEGHFQILISTGQFLGEGTDLDNLECLILAYPFAFEGKLIQYMGRVQRTEVTPVIYDYRDIHIDYLEKQFRQRNRHYKKLMNTGQIKKFDELTLFFNENAIFVNSDACVLPISSLELSLGIEKFKEGVAWKVRVLCYDEESCELMTEIIDYHAKPDMNNCKQGDLQFLIIDKIKFRDINTGHLLRAVELNKNPVIQKISEPAVNYEISNRVGKHVVKPVERMLSKTMKVPFNKILFLHACISFRVFIDELQQEITFEIENPDIRPEFEAIKDYFIKILKKKLIAAQIEIRYTDKEIMSINASSEDIDKINGSVIDNVRFEFVKKEIFTFKGNPESPTVINTLDNLLAIDKVVAGKIFKSEQDLIDNILNIKNSKHYYQLKFLSSKHLSAVLKIRFILKPFSFLFLLIGEKKYHIVWETLNSEEATYIWHFEKSMDALRKGLKEIEIILNDIKATSKLDYLRKEHDNFSRVIHDYADVKSGFTVWRGVLEEKLI
ncbi:MAG: DEAD/DEAH box helicase [Chitinophagaceae bacterium]|nr:DEAD/DEAH box helicase [Chitinophagaceae bacterium]